jgi:Flp pilus assembly protein protease CpaA
MISLALSIALALVALVAAWSDIRTRRIPNRLTVGALVLALALRLPLGPEALLSGIAGLSFAFILVFPLFALGGFGGGDAKLLMAMGAFLGVEGLFPGLLAIGVIGAAMALVLALRRVVDRFPGRAFDGRGGGTPTSTLPYGVAIGIGAVLGHLFGLPP